MLAITLKEGDYFMIGDNIVVKYVSNINKFNHVSIGIDAPRELKISRGSVYEREIESKISQNEATLSDLEKARAMKGKYRKDRTDRTERTERTERTVVNQ